MRRCERCGVTFDERPCTVTDWEGDLYLVVCPNCKPGFCADFSGMLG